MDAQSQATVAAVIGAAATAYFLYRRSQAIEAVPMVQTTKVSEAGSNVKGKHCMVTGCTSGIGMAAVRLIAAKKPACIYLACRSQSKGEVLQKELAELGVKSVILLGDMGTAAGCLTIASAMIKTGKPLDVLMSNAGIWNVSKEAAAKAQMTTDGFEAHFGTNYMSMVVLLTELKDLMEKSKTRVVITGSFTSVTIVKGVVDFDNLQGEKKTTTMVYNDVVYAQSKLLQYMWARKFSTLVAPGVSIVIFDPGQCETNNEVYTFMKKNLKMAFPLFKRVMGMRDPSGGAEVAMWAMDSPEAADINGTTIDWGEKGKHKCYVPQPLGSGKWPSHNLVANALTDDAQVDRLWKITEELRVKACKK